MTTTNATTFPRNTLSGHDAQHAQPPHPFVPGERALDFQLQLQSTSALLTVLATIARLGCEIRTMHVVGRHAHLRVHPPLQVKSHRVEACLSQVVGVLSVSERELRMDAKGGLLV